MPIGRRWRDNMSRFLSYLRVENQCKTQSMLKLVNYLTISQFLSCEKSNVHHIHCMTELQPRAKVGFLNCFVNGVINNDILLLTT